mmetsp:Transcript_37405/g.93045  ORF Transcript_37405/g.93045 Transcript_37405/m.93045 type:complete len:282 (-) Transcript_37405:137-982(-)
MKEAGAHVDEASLPAMSPDTEAEGEAEAEAEVETDAETDAEADAEGAHRGYISPTSQTTPELRRPLTTELRRLMSATVNSTNRGLRLANVPSAYRSLSTTGGSEWHQQTPSYARSMSNFGAIGSPGQDLRRLAVGPSLYINGPPDRGPKATLATVVANRRAGRFGKDMGPGSMITVLQLNPPNCSRSIVGPDPYDTTIANAWQRRQRTIAFAAEDGKTRSSEWQNLKLAVTRTYADVRRPLWLKRSQSHQVLQPSNRMHPGSERNIWTPETHRPWPAVLPQ